MERTRKRADVNRILIILLVCLLVLLLTGIAIYCYFAIYKNNRQSSVTPSDKNLCIDYIDVGQGDCELIIQGDTVILIDGGEAEYADTVISQLDSRSVETIDCYILTHPHSDHIGAAAEIMSEFTIGTVVSTTLSDESIPTTKTYERTLDAIDEFAQDYLEVTGGETYTLGDLTLDILAPISVSDELNDMSVCCKITYGSFTALFCGDATQTVENELLDSGAGLKADVFKVSHHGSSTSNSEDFIKAVSPEICVISCGADNSYGHPHKETLDTLNELNIDYIRTDIKGTITVSSDGETYSISTEK